jgi:hypothetical protein
MCIHESFVDPSIAGAQKARECGPSRVIFHSLPEGDSESDVENIREYPVFTFASTNERIAASDYAWLRSVRAFVSALHTFRHFLLILGSGMCAPAYCEDSIDVVRRAFRVSDSQLTSGTARGVYRYYVSRAGGDWELMVDSEIAAYFDQQRYHLFFQHSRDRVRGNTVERIIFDGEAIRIGWFSPLFHPTGAQGVVSRPENLNDGISRPRLGYFVWDITKLARNVWNPDVLFRDSGPPKLVINETPEGDVIGTFLVRGGRGDDRVRFECARRFGFNIHLLEVFNGRYEHPVQQSRFIWAQSPSGLWYVTMLDQISVMLVGNNPKERVRRILKYSSFDANARVEPSMFKEKSLALPAGTWIVDNREGYELNVKGKDP